MQQIFYVSKITPSSVMGGLIDTAQMTQTLGKGQEGGDLFTCEESTRHALGQHI